MSLLLDMKLMSCDKSVDLTEILSCDATLFECLLSAAYDKFSACDVTSLNYCFLDPQPAMAIY